MVNNPSMKTWIYFLIISMNVVSAWAVEVEFKLTHFKLKPSVINLAVFNQPNDFPDNGQEAFKTLQKPIDLNQEVQVISVDLPPGSYAVSTFVDENGNLKLDTNFLGIPVENFGFSLNPKIMFGPPRFEQCEFEVKDQPVKMTIKLNRLL